MRPLLDRSFQAIEPSSETPSVFSATCSGTGDLVNLLRGLITIGLILERSDGHRLFLLSHRSQVIVRPCIGSGIHGGYMTGTPCADHFDNRFPVSCHLIGGFM